MRIRIALILAALALGAVAAAVAELPDRIIMPHRTHFENGVECAMCHEGVEESTSAGESFRPSMDVCANCHDVEDGETCGTCHTNVDMAGDYPPLAFGAGPFPHAAHLEYDIACASCHGDPAAAEPVIPGKPDCRGCHETADEYGDCRMCHGDDDELRPATHGAQWDLNHGAWARDDQASCALCHTQTTCQECHAGDNVRPRSHTLNFAFEHAAKARGHEMECATCHREPDFCASCHRAQQVLPRSHSRVGWVRASDGGQHAIDGVFEIESCIACHSDGPDAPTCAACHGG
jgi:hypothetical protein